MKTQVNIIIAGEIKLPQTRSLRVKWYQDARLIEEE